MKRIGHLAGLLLLLSACHGSAPPQLATGAPSLATGTVALENGSPDVALRICSQHVASDPRDLNALVCQGDALTALGRADEADAVYTKVLALNHGSLRALLGLGRLRLASDPKRAEELFLQALQQNPRNAVVLNDLGIARDLQGNHADAQKAYGDAIAADPDMRAARVNLALSVALQGRPGDAARELLPLAGGLNASTRERHDLAAILVMNGHTEEAMKLLSPELQGADLDAAIAGYRALAPH